MATVDFTDWAAGDLVLALGGEKFSFPPPTVQTGRLLVAMAVQAEIQLGLVEGDLPDDLAELIDEAGKRPLGEVCLGVEGHQRLMDAGVPGETIRRMSLYALFFWVRGRDRADVLAEAMWRQDAEQEAEPEAPKDPKGSTSGRSTGSGSRTKTASTRTTASRSTSSPRTRKKPDSTAKQKPQGESSPTGPTSSPTGTP